MTITSSTGPRWTPVLRWLAVVPVGVLCVVVVSFPIHWVVLLITSGRGEDASMFGLGALPPRTLERLAQAFFSPLVFISAGSWTAPAHRVQTAVGLLIVWAIALGAFLMYAATSGAYSGWAWVEFVVALALGVAGAVAALYGVHRKASDGGTISTWRGLR